MNGPLIVQSPLISLYQPRTPKRSSSNTLREQQRKKEEENLHRKEEEMFVSTKRIVNELGGLKLRGKARFDWENKQRVQRGGIPIPSPKTPYKILQGMIKKQKERNEKSIKKALEQGITPPKKHLTTTKKALRQRDRTGPDPHRGLTTSLGRYKKGILHIDKELIRQTESSSTNTDRKKARPAQKPQTKGKKKGKKWK